MSVSVDTALGSFEDSYIMDISGENPLIDEVADSLGIQKATISGEEYPEGVDFLIVVGADYVE